MAMNKYGVEYICPKCNTEMDVSMEKLGDGRTCEVHLCKNKKCRFVSSQTYHVSSDQDQNDVGSGSQTSDTGR